MSQGSRQKFERTFRKSSCEHSVFEVYFLYLGGGLTSIAETRVFVAGKCTTFANYRDTTPISIVLLSCKSTPSSWQKVIYTRHQFVSRDVSHLYRDAFAEVLGSGVVGNTPNLYPMTWQLEINRRNWLQLRGALLKEPPRVCDEPVIQDPLRPSAAHLLGWLRKEPEGGCSLSLHGNAVLKKEIN